MLKRAAAALVTVAAATTMSQALVVGPAQAAPYYSSCDDLHRDYAHGVAKSRAAASKAVRDGYGRPSYSRTAKAVYWENHSRLDRDGDGTACEA